MKKSRRILILGIGQSNFLDQLYGDILKNSTEYTFSTGKYLALDNTAKANSIYDHNFDFENQKITGINLFASFIHFFFEHFFWKIIFFELSKGSSFSTILSSLKSYNRSRYIALKVIAPQQWDAVHFHFCTPTNLAILQFLPPSTKSICSFWGSDLMRTTGVSNVFYVGRALGRCAHITIQTRELGERLFCKYGRHFQDKTSFLRFTINTEIYSDLDELEQNTEPVTAFRNFYNIPLNNRIVAIGHNAFKENQHLKIIEQLVSLPVEFKSTTTFLIHLAYGGYEEYTSNLSEYAKNIDELHIICIRDYMDPFQMAVFRKASQVFVHLPVTDALSGAMTEVLYAGNKVITGSWLPYAFLKDNGIDFSQISELSDLPSKICEVLAHEVAFPVPNKNKQIIKDILFPNVTTKSWIELFQRII